MELTATNSRYLQYQLIAIAKNIPEKTTAQFYCQVNCTLRPVPLNLGRQADSLPHAETGTHTEKKHKATPKYN